MSLNPSAVPHQRIDEIEVLRALAIAITLVHHVFYYLLVWHDDFRDQTYSYFTFWGGVDVFFVVSGFVIARDFFARQRLSQKGTSFWRISMAFWLRRAFRILPSAWLWLLIFLLATLFLNESTAFGTYERSLGDSFAAFFQIANFHQFKCAQREALCGINGVYWSLSLEEQFYLLLPIVAFVSRKYLPYVLLIGWLTQFFISRPEWSLGWAFRTDGFILGVLLALWSQQENYLKFAPKFLERFSLLRWLSVIFLAMAVLVIPAPPHKIPWAVGWVSLVCVIMVWIASYGMGYLMRPGPLRRLLVWVGSRSYGIYLTHMFAFRLTIEIFYRDLPKGQLFTSDSSLSFLALALPLTFALSELNYRVVEQPLRLWGRRISAKMSVENL